MSLSSYRNKEYWAIIAFFIISCVHTIGLLVAMLALLFYIKQGVRGSIKALLLIAIRTPMSPAIAVPFGSLQTMKWIFIFGFCAWILLNSKKIEYERAGKLNSAVLSLTVFVVVAAIESIVNASYPITALFKLFSYYFVCSAIIRGVAATEFPEEFLSLSLMILTPMIMISVVLIPFDSFRLINDTFQGVFNHPNMFGIMGAVYTGLLVMYKRFYGKGNTLLIIVVLIMIFLTTSRTGMLAAIFCVVVGYKYLFPPKTRVLVFVGALFALILMWPSFWTVVRNFLFKYGEDTILYSRMGQRQLFQYRFNAHPVLGSGFAVPYNPGLRDLSLNMNLNVEPGNIVWAILGDCGIVGFVFFVVHILTLVFYRFDFKRVLFVAVPIVVSMGEMAFFSVNSIAMIYYVMFGLYLFIDDDKQEGIVEQAAY